MLEADHLLMDRSDLGTRILLELDTKGVNIRLYPLEFEIRFNRALREFPVELR